MVSRAFSVSAVLGLVAIITAVTAQSTSSIVPLLIPGAQYIPGVSSQSLVGSVVTAQPAATTYLVQCQPGHEVIPICSAQLTVVNGPATAALTLSADALSVQVMCANSASVLSCTETISDIRTTMTAVGTVPFISNLMMFVTLTGGLDVLTAPTATSTITTTVATITSTAVPGASSGMTMAMATSTSTLATDLNVTTIHSATASVAMKTSIADTSTDHTDSTTLTTSSNATVSTGSASGNSMSSGARTATAKLGGVVFGLAGFFALFAAVFIL